MSDIIIEKILDAVDRGVPTAELRKDYEKHILSGKTKKIVINSGGEGLKVSYEILQEMKNRGDCLATEIIEKDVFNVIDDYGYSKNAKGDNKTRDKQWTFLDIKSNYYDYEYDRENKTLIEIIEENKIKNIGGWDLDVVEVPIEEWAWHIENLRDHWRSEIVNFLISNKNYKRRRFRNKN